MSDYDGIIETVSTLLQDDTTVATIRQVAESAGVSIATVSRVINNSAAVTVVGFDDSDARNYVYPKMTAVCQDARQLGYEAFAELARAVEAGNGSRCQHRISSTWLEINNSTGQPPKNSVGILSDGTRLMPADC